MGILYCHTAPMSAIFGLKWLRKAARDSGVTRVGVTRGDN